MVYMIGNAHLDPVWLWTKLEGFGEVISTMQSALRRIEEEDKFVFTCSSACYYDYVKNHDIELFEKIRKCVKSGKWNIVGGWWIQPDDNLPSGEMYARHALYSQRFYLKEFGITCKTGYCVDTFGHNSALPQLLQQSGMENFVFMRPSCNEKKNIPSLFYWNTVDGSSVLTYKITAQNYNNFGSDGMIADIDKNIVNSEKNGYDMMCFYGVGNHGGGPTRKQMTQINEQIASGKSIKFGGVDEYFDNARKSNFAIESYTGDLQHHAIGCYSVASHIKELERKAEIEISKAEKLMFLSNKLLGKKYDNEAIIAGYKDIMFNNFHDILCGCCVKEGLDNAVSYYHEAIALSNKIKEKSIVDISKNIDTMIDGVTQCGKTDWQIWEEDNLGIPLVMFNTNSFPIKKRLMLSRVFNTCVDDKGKVLEIQYVKGKYLDGLTDKATLLEVEIPAFGYTTYWVYKDKKLTAIESNTKIAEDNILENELLKVTFNKENGGVSSIISKPQNKEFISGSAFVPKIYADNTDTWSHQNVSRFTQDECCPMQFCNLKVIESGSIVGKIRVKYKYNSSYVVLEYSLARGEDILRVDAKVNYSEMGSFMRLTADTTLKDTKAIFEVPFGYIEKESSGCEQPALRYSALKSADGGLGIVTDSKSSFCLDDNKISFIAVRNSIYANHYGTVSDDEYDCTDEGLQRFVFNVAPFSQDISPEKLAQIAESESEIDFLLDSYHEGKLARQNGYISIDKNNIIVSAVKRAEDNDGDIIRLSETSQVDTIAEVTYFDKKFSLTFRKNEVKSVYLYDNGKIKETNFCEE